MFIFNGLSHSFFVMGASSYPVASGFHVGVQLLAHVIGGPEEMKLLLKILAAPVVAVLTVFVWVCVLMLHISALILGLAGTVVALLGAESAWDAPSDPG